MFKLIKIFIELFKKETHNSCFKKRFRRGYIEKGHCYDNHKPLCKDCPYYKFPFDFAPYSKK